MPAILLYALATCLPECCFSPTNTTTSIPMCCTMSLCKRGLGCFLAACLPAEAVQNSNGHLLCALRRLQATKGVLKEALDGRLQHEYAVGCNASSTAAGEALQLS